MYLIPRNTTPQYDSPYLLILSIRKESKKSNWVSSVASRADHALRVCLTGRGLHSLCRVLCYPRLITVGSCYDILTRLSNFKNRQSQSSKLPLFVTEPSVDIGGRILACGSQPLVMCSSGNLTGIVSLSTQ